MLQLNPLPNTWLCKPTSHHRCSTPIVLSKKKLNIELKLTRATRGKLKKRAQEVRKRLATVVINAGLN